MHLLVCRLAFVRLRQNNNVAFPIYYNKTITLNSDNKRCMLYILHNF